MVLEISSTLVERLLSEAAASPDAEICGLVFGTEHRIEAFDTCRNVAADSRRHFEIDPAALFAALRTERAGGRQVLGYWHSHPSGDVAPSPTDAAMAVPDGKLWLIVTGRNFSLWRAGSRLEAVPVAVT